MMKHYRLFFLLLGSLFLYSCDKEIELEGGIPEKKLAISCIDSDVDFSELYVGESFSLEAEWNFLPSWYHSVEWTASNNIVRIERSYDKSYAHSYDRLCRVTPLSPGTTTITASIGGETASIDVTVRQINPEFSAVSNGYYKGTYTIENKNYEYDSFLWDFGDGYTNSTYSGVIHTYSRSGWYTVTLTLYKNGHSASTSKDVYIYY